MKWPPGWKRKGMKRGRGEPEYKHMMKKRGRVRKDVTLMRQMNKSDTGEESCLEMCKRNAGGKEWKPSMHKGQSRNE